MKPSELYQRTPESIDYDLGLLKGFSYNHLPEITFDFPWIDGQRADPGKRVRIHYYKNHCFDGRRVWILAGVFFDNKPVMITRNAGREGDDHSSRFVTDPVLYQEMLLYLNTLNPVKSEAGDICNAEDDIPELDSFYGHKLGDYFDRY